MKKKLLFTAYNLDLGGIETALINLLNELNTDSYDITLILDRKEGIFLNSLPKNIRVLEYKVKYDGFILYKKIYNRLKLIKWKLKLKNKYDFSCSYATYFEVGAQLALAASKNSTLWMHANYYILYNRNQDEMKKFMDSIFANRFKRLVFVSEENKKDVVSHYDGIKDKSIVCNNFINYKDIIEKSKEKVDFKKGKNPTLINVGRHEENQKKLSRIINACERLKSEGYKFQVLFIGDGPDNEGYKKEVKKLDLEDTILFLGKKKNPFPYYKLSDAVILSSDFEGYPVVFLEAMTLNKPILSTKVSDWEKLDGVYGDFCNTNDESIYKLIKNYLDHGLKYKEKFDYISYNRDVMKIIESMINFK